MYNFQCLIFYLYLCSRFATAKLIIYDGNIAIKHVNNCYRYGFFMRETAFS
jgi:hypothetical protein